MSVKKIELKVTVSCEKCKIQLMQAVAKLEGIDAITVNAEKGIMTVLGTVDPVCVVTKIRKTKKCVEIISIGPPKKPDDPKKPCEPIVCKPLPPCCKQCQLVVVSYESQDSSVCSIL